MPRKVCTPSAETPRTLPAVVSTITSDIPSSHLSLFFGAETLGAGSGLGADVQLTIPCTGAFRPGRGPSGDRLPGPRRIAAGDMQVSVTTVDGLFHAVAAMAEQTGHRIVPRVRRRL